MSERPPDTQSYPTAPPTVAVQVDLNALAVWEVSLPGEPDRVRCDTLEDAQRVARLYASQHKPCELLMHDAYHRVLMRELITDRARRSG